MAKRDHPSYLRVVEDNRGDALVVAHIETGGVVVRHVFGVDPDGSHNHKHSDRMRSRYHIKHEYDGVNDDRFVCVMTPLDLVTTGFVPA